MREKSLVKMLVALMALMLLLVTMVKPGSYEYDTTALSYWCSPEERVRMIGAEYFDVDALIDESGNIWNVEMEEDFDPDAFYLLWIGDGNTPREMTDDEVLKVWKEVL